MEERPETKKPQDHFLLPSLESQISEFHREVQDLEEFFGLEVSEPDFHQTLGKPSFVKGSDSHYDRVDLNPFWNAARHEARHFVHDRVACSVSLQNPDGIKSFYENEIPDDWKPDGEINRYNAGATIVCLNYDYDIQPEFFAHGECGVLPEQGVRQNIVGRKAETLTISNLEEYSERDRRRAMLYNSQIEESIDEFLKLLDRHQIQ
jgi:hypothetical protein